MRRFHRANSLIVLDFLDLVDLLHLIKNVLELSNKVACTDHDQFALACLTDSSEFHLCFHNAWHILSNKKIGRIIRLCFLIRTTVNRVKCLLSASHRASSHPSSLFGLLLVVIHGNYSLLVKGLAGFEHSEGHLLWSAFGKLDSALEENLAFANHVHIGVRFVTFTHDDLLVDAGLFAEKLTAIHHVEARIHGLHLGKVLMEEDDSLLLSIFDVLAYDQIVGFCVHLKKVSWVLIVEGNGAKFLWWDRVLIPWKGLLAHQTTNGKLFHCSRGRSTCQGKIFLTWCFWCILVSRGIKEEHLTVENEMNMLGLWALSRDHLSALVLLDFDEFKYASEHLIVHVTELFSEQWVRLDVLTDFRYLPWSLIILLASLHQADELLDTLDVWVLDDNFPYRKGICGLACCGAGRHICLLWSCWRRLRLFFWLLLLLLLSLFTSFLILGIGALHLIFVFYFQF